jgi:hypothetical protein
MSKQKPRGSDDDILGLIFLKRKRAREAMDSILKGLDHCPWNEPTLTVLLDYISNMVYCLELMAKLLSGDWNNHDVGAMYQKVYSRAHGNPDFVNHLKLSLTNQKYFYEPATDPARPGTSQSIADFIPEIEQLFDEFRQEIAHRHPVHSVHKELTLPIRVGEYLRDNVWRFYQAEPIPGQPSAEQMEAAQVQFMEKLKDVAGMINHYLQVAKGLGVAEVKMYHISALR